jgi:hypothetical protein
VVMRVMVERCCGLDVHQEAVVACLLIGAPGVKWTPLGGPLGPGLKVEAASS